MESDIYFCPKLIQNYQLEKPQLRGRLGDIGTFVGMGTESILDKILKLCRFFRPYLHFRRYRAGDEDHPVFFFRFIL